MLTPLQTANKAFLSTDYVKAIQYYGQCAFSKPSDLTLEERNAACYMLVFLYLRTCNFDQALIYFRQLGDAHFKSTHLPLELQDIPIYQVLCSAIQQYKGTKFIELNISDCQITSAIVQDFTAAIKSCDRIVSLEIQDNPLTEQDVEAFIEAILKKPFLNFANFNKLPISSSAAQKIGLLICSDEALVDKFDFSELTPAPVQLDLKIDLTDCSIPNLSPIINAIKKCKQRSVFVAVKGVALPNSCTSSILGILRKDVNTIDLVSPATQCSDYSKSAQKFLNSLHLLEQQSDTLLKNNNQQTFIKILDAGKVVLGKILANQHLSANNLTIYAPNAELIIDSDIDVIDEINLFSKSLILNPNTQLSANHVNIRIESKVLLQGQIDSPQVRIDCKHYELDSTAKIYCSTLNSDSRFIIHADSAHIRGHIDQHTILLDCAYGVMLYRGSVLKSQEIYLSSLTSIECSSDIKAVSVYFHAAQKITLTHKSLLQIQQAHFSSYQLFLHGNILDCTLLELNAEERILIESDADVTAERILINGKNIESHGTMSSTVLSYQGDLIKVSGTITSKTSDEKNSIPALLSVQSKDCVIEATIDAQGSLAIQSDQVFFTHRAHITSPIKNENTKSHIKCTKKLSMDTGSVLEPAGDLIIQARNFSMHGKINPKGSLFLEVEGCGEVFKEAHVLSGKHINIEGGRYWNSGEIKATEQLNIAMDRFFINGICDFDPVAKFRAGKSFGSVAGESVTITAAFYMNLLACVSSTKSVQVNSFVEINVGAMRGINISHSNIIGIDLGINLTVIDSIKSILHLLKDMKDAAVSKDKRVKEVIKEYYDKTDGTTIALSGVSFALQMAAIAGKLLVIFAPQVGIPMSLALSAANLLLQLALNGMHIKSEIKRLIDLKQTGRTIHARDVYRLILAAKNIALSGANLAMMGVHMPDTISHLPDQIKNSHEDILGTLPNFASLFAGSVTTQSVVDIKGLSFTLTGTSSDMSALNFDLFHTNISGLAFENSLVSNEQFCTNISAMRIVDAKDITERHGNTIVNSESVIGENAVVGGNTLAQQLSVKVGDFTQEGYLQAHSMMVSATHAQLNGELISQGGAVQADSIQLSKDSDVSLSNMGIKTDHLNINGKATLSDLAIDSRYITESATTHLDVHHCSLKATNDIQFAGENNFNTAIVDAHTLKFDANAHVKFDTTSVKTTHFVESAGSQIETDKTWINTTDMHLAGHSVMHDTALELQDLTFTASSQTDFNNVSLKANNITEQLGSQIATDTVSITAIDIDLLGSNNFKNTAIESKTIHFETGSQNYLENVFVKANDITQAINCKMEVNNVGFSGDKVDLHSDIKVHNAFQIEATQEVDIHKGAKIDGKEDGKVYVSAPKVDEEERICAKEIGLKSHFSNDEVNNRIHHTAESYIPDTLTIETDVALNITQQADGAQTVNLIATSIVNNVEQHVHNLHLESTKGSIDINKKITGDTITCVSEKNLNIHDTIKGHEVYGIAKGDIIIDKEKQSTSVPSDHFHQRQSFKRPELSRYHDHNAKKPEQIMLSGDTLVLQSDHSIKMEGVNAKAKQLALVATDDIVLDGEKIKPNRHNRFDYLSAFKTSIQGKETYISARNLVNNGQRIASNLMQIDVKNNIYNLDAGFIGATNFLSIQAHNFYNTNKQMTVHGDYGDYIIYQPAILQGGDGTGTDGVGLYMHLDGELFNDASSIQSVGTNILKVDKGIHNIAESNTYTSYEKDDSSWLGLKQTHEEHQDTIVGRSSIISAAGKNIIYVADGGMDSTATDFIATYGTDIYTKGNAQFYDLVTSSTVTKNSRSMGIFYSDEKKYDEYSSPTAIASYGDINIISDADIVMRGTEITTPAHLQIAAQNFDFSVSKLKHSYDKSSFGMSASLFNQQFFGTNTPCSASGALVNNDPTYCHVNQTLHSNGAVETGLNAWNTGIDVLNTSNMIAQGLQSGNLLCALGRRYAPALFNPQLNITFTKSQQSMNYESSGNGSINVGSADFVVKNKVEIKGAPVQVAGNLSIDCKHLILKGEDLKSSVDQKTQSVTLTVSSTGDPYQIGASVQGYHCNSTDYVNQELNVGGTLTLHVNQMEQDCSNITAGHIQGEVGDYRMISRTSSSQSDGYLYSVSSGGQFAAQQQHCDSQVVLSPSTLHILDSINGTNPNEFVVHHLYTEGGVINSDGVNNFHADSIDSQAVEEYQHTSGFSISGNYRDFITSHNKDNHLIPVCNDIRQISTMNTSFTKGNYESNYESVIFGQQGTNIISDRINGIIHTDSIDGRRVIDNTQHTYNLDIPFADKETLEQLKQNALWVEAKASNIAQAISNKARSLFFADTSRQDKATMFPSQNSDGKYSGGKRFSDPTYKPEFNSQDDVYVDDGSFEPWQKTAMGYVDNNSTTFDDVDYVYQSPTSYEEQAEEYFDDQIAPIYDVNLDNKASDYAVTQDDLREAYARGRVAGTTGDIPDYVNDWPEEMQNTFYQGLGEGQGISLVGKGALAFVPLVGGLVGNLVSLGLRTYGLFKAANEVISEISDVFHSVPNKESAQGVVDGIDPGKLSAKNRFGRGLYLSEIPETTLAELAYHDNVGEFTIRFNFDDESAIILDLTEQDIANEWGYKGGEDYLVPQQIAINAQEEGYNVIRFPSERGQGNNLVIFKDFDTILSPQMISPVPKKPLISNDELNPTINFHPK